MFNINPKKMQSMMSQMGIKQEEINALRVIIEKEDGKIIIEDPSVVKIVMQGQESFQISGEVKEEKIEDSEQYGKNKWEEDIQTIISKTGCSREDAEKTLDGTNGDLADAILALS